MTFVIAKMPCRKMDIEASKHCKKLCCPAFTAKQLTTGALFCSQAFSLTFLVQSPQIPKIRKCKIQTLKNPLPKNLHIGKHLCPAVNLAAIVKSEHIFLLKENLKSTSNQYLKACVNKIFCFPSFFMNCARSRRFYDFESFASHQLQCLAFDYHNYSRRTICC